MSLYKHFSSLSAVLLLLVGLSGCIENDIPYPRIAPNFTRFAVEDQSQVATIDSINRSITVLLSEQADINNVKVTDYALSKGGFLADSTIFDSPIDLAKPMEVDVELYQQYTWTITARQTIDRYFTVSNQVGASVIDAPGHRVVASVPESVSLKAIKVLSIKLGAEGSTMSPDLTGETVDFSHPVKVNVTEYGRTSEWTIYIDQTASSVTTVGADAWTNVAWLYGSAEAGKDNGFEYRLADSQDWIKVPADWLTHDGGSFTGRLIHLMAESTYVARAYSDSEYGTEVEFTTGSAPQLPNGSMDNWWLDGKIWCPWGEGQTPYWGTGNKGATTLGPSNSVPTDETSSGTGQAAMLETKFVGIGMLGKLAAGNLFTGDYIKTDGTNGILSFGRPFTDRPTRLTGYFKYHSAPISSTTEGFTDLKDRPDSCIIWCALWAGDQPFEIRTNPKNRQLFDPTLPDVVAYGAMEVGYDVNAYKEFDIPLVYTSTSRKPRYIIVCCSASKYGDYFTGGNGSVLWVDNFELQYDY